MRCILVRDISVRLFEGVLYVPTPEELDAILMIRTLRVAGGQRMYTEEFGRNKKKTSRVSDPERPL